MAIYTQLNRPLRITTPLGIDVLLLTGMEGHAALSELFSFRLELVAPPLVSVPFDQLLGKEVHLEVDLPSDDGTRFFSGIVISISRLGQDKTFTRYEVQMAPQAWLLTRRVQSRIFQQQTVPEILAAVLVWPELKVDYVLSGEYPSRDYCVQYNESDFAFASRLMEEEGIYYYFMHSNDGHRMVVTDDAHRLPTVDTPDIVLFDPEPGVPRNSLRVNSWKKTQQICPATQTLWDQSFELPGKNLEATMSIRDSVKAGRVEHSLSTTALPLEVYQFPGGYAKWFDGVSPTGEDRPNDVPQVYQQNERIARLRNEETAADSLWIDGTGNCLSFFPGGRFTLMNHVDGDGRYVLTRVEHQAQCDPPYRSGDEKIPLNYSNRFRCLPEELPYRPPRLTPKPTIQGPQTAVVVGAQGQEIFIDKYGRIKVQFPWDRQGKNDGDSSCWIRVGQVWAGPHWGAFFWPRIGHEVIVAFEHGDPDQPIVVGSVYNAKNMPPVDLPDENKIAGIKSCSFGGDPTANFNGIVFHDVPGNEFTHVHSELNQMNNSENDRFQGVVQGDYQFQGNVSGMLKSLM